MAIKATGCGLVSNQCIESEALFSVFSGRQAVKARGRCNDEALRRTLQPLRGGVLRRMAETWASDPVKRLAIARPASPGAGWSPIRNPPRSRARPAATFANRPGLQVNVGAATIADQIHPSKSAQRTSSFCSPCRLTSRERAEPSFRRPTVTRTGAGGPSPMADAALDRGSLETARPRPPRPRQSGSRRTSPRRQATTGSQNRHLLGPLEWGPAGRGSGLPRVPLLPRARSAYFCAPWSFGVAQPERRDRSPLEGLAAFRYPRHQGESPERSGSWRAMRSRPNRSNAGSSLAKRVLALETGSSW